MIHLSIYWTNDSDDLGRMLRELGGERGEIGHAVGNDGCELLVNYREYVSICEYVSQHQDELELSVYGAVAFSAEEAEQMSESWKAQQEA